MDAHGEQGDETVSRSLGPLRKKAVTSALHNGPAASCRNWPLVGEERADAVAMLSVKMNSHIVKYEIIAVHQYFSI